LFQVIVSRHFIAKIANEKQQDSTRKGLLVNACFAGKRSRRWHQKYRKFPRVAANIKAQPPANVERAGIGLHFSHGAQLKNNLRRP
jgi:hypothetical protein